MLVIANNLQEVYHWALLLIHHEKYFKAYVSAFEKKKINQEHRFHWGRAAQMTCLMTIELKLIFSLPWICIPVQNQTHSVDQICWLEPRVCGFHCHRLSKQKKRGKQLVRHYSQNYINIYLKVKQVPYLSFLGPLYLRHKFECVPTC